MKYKRYFLKFDSADRERDQEVLDFLRRHVAEQQGDLGRARALGRAAKLLLGVDYKVTSVTVPKPTAERVRSL